MRYHGEELAQMARELFYLDHAGNMVIHRQERFPALGKIVVNTLCVTVRVR